jgi:hypothetical protein
LLQPVLKADLPDAATVVVQRVRDIAAVAPDVAELMDTVPPLAAVARYGDVRQTDQEMVRQALAEIFARICVGLPLACGSLNDEAARLTTDRIARVHQAVSIFDVPHFADPWRDCLQKITNLPNVHGLVSGRCCRLLFDTGNLAESELSARASQSLSPGTDPAVGAAWIEGFLEKSGDVLLASQKLWEVVDSFIQDLTCDAFQSTLPLLRRTFSTFAGAERRQLGERVREGAQQSRTPAASTIDEARAARALPLLIEILGLNDDAN